MDQRGESVQGHPISKCRLDRRRLLGWIGAGTALSLRPAFGQVPAQPDIGTPSRRRVIVVGSGVAGLTAAKALRARGIEVIVLEGGNRVGGRIHTQNVGGSTVDLGASYVHGRSAQNPLVRYLQRIGVPVDADSAPTRMFEEGLGSLPQWRLNSLYQRFDDFISSLPSLRATLGAQANVREGVGLFLSQAGYSGVALERTRFLFNSVLADYAAPLEDLSLEWLWEESEFSGGDGFPRGTYAPMIQELSRSLDVRLNTRVNAIEQSRRGVRVHTSNATYSGALVIVTVSLGVLQSAAIQFLPGLPAGKAAAIGRLGMGSMEKVVLSYPSQFWSGVDSTYFRSSVDGRFPFMRDMTALAGAPTVMGFAMGSYADQMQATPAATSIAEFEPMLEETAGQAAPALQGTHVTSWRSDPLFLGSYSYLKPGASPADRQALGAPWGRIRFAGEATSVEYASTVHGAMMTGLREASRIVGAQLTVEDL
ncbi:MAG: NAD(P)/FAD-dependent oxidoreductase [Planctomycetota bacterium]